MGISTVKYQSMNLETKPAKERGPADSEKKTDNGKDGVELECVK